MTARARALNRALYHITNNIEFSNGWKTLNPASTEAFRKEVVFMKNQYVGEGTVVRTKRLTPKQLEKRNERIERMYATGKYTQRQIADIVGISRTRVGEIVGGY